MRRRELVDSISPGRKGHDKSVPWNPDELTHREAEAVVTEVFGSISEALRNGETVKLPFGTFEVVDQPRAPLRRWFLNRVRVTYAKRKVVRFTFGE
jgi:nucleoid DNA-binding protein